MPEAKLYEEDSEVTIEREERQILATEHITVAIDIQTTTAYELTAIFCKLIEYQAAIAAEQTNITISYTDLAIFITRYIKIFETIVSILIQLLIYTFVNKLVRIR